MNNSYNVSDCPSRVRLEVDLSRIRRNFQTIKSYAAPAKVIAVLKANAYGLGVLPIARTLKQANADCFGVAELNEALQLIDLDVPIMILGNLLPQEVALAVKNDIICPVNDYFFAKIINDEAAKQHKKVKIHLKIDTGMGRLGMIYTQAVETVMKIKELPNLEIKGIYSHFPVAFAKYDHFTLEQIERFKNVLHSLEAKGINFEYIHIAASDAINNFPESCKLPFNTIRAGINLYGYYDNDVRERMHLDPVITLKTSLAAVRTLPANYTIGYGRMCKLLTSTRVGTIAAGYADGLPLAMSNRGYVLVRGILCPVLGRLSMDYTTISLENVPDAEWGDEVVCIGTQQDNTISLDNWAQLKGTHAYELLCSFGSRVKRIYLD